MLYKMPSPRYLLRTRYLGICRCLFAKRYLVAWRYLLRTRYLGF
jgi:hypothetical protein